MASKAAERSNGHQDVRRPTTSWRYHTDSKTNIEIAIWENQQEGDNGPYTTYNVTFRRSFRTEAGGWETNNSFRPQDLLPLARGLEKAFDWIQDAKQQQ